VRAGLADAAVPQDQRGVGLDDLEGVAALAWVCHPGRRVGGHGGEGEADVSRVAGETVCGDGVSGADLGVDVRGEGALTEVGEW